MKAHAIIDRNFFFLYIRDLIRSNGNSRWLITKSVFKKSSADGSQRWYIVPHLAQVHDSGYVSQLPHHSQAGRSLMFIISASREIGTINISSRFIISTSREIGPINISSNSHNFIIITYHDHIIRFTNGRSRVSSCPSSLASPSTSLF